MLQDLLGLRYGLLKVSKFSHNQDRSTEKYKKKDRIWECLCDCGNICYVSTQDLNGKSVKSCGCLKRGPKRPIDLIGTRFGKLLIKSIPNIDSNGDTKFLCLCDCGIYEEYYKKQLIRNLKCRQCIALEHNIRDELPKWIFTRNKWTAYRRNLEYSISFEYLQELYEKQNKKCALSGLPIYFTPSSRTRDCGNASLDRINNNFGYIEGNVQWLDKHVNIMKMDLSQEDFIHLSYLIGKNYVSTSSVSNSN